MEEEPQFKDDLFRVKKKNGEWKVVDAPDFGHIALADAHTHLQYATDPVMTLARAGLHGVSYMCTVLDVFDGDEEVFERIKPWSHQAAVNMQLMIGRC
ncbi:MAG: nitrate ABC transporter substrate-binding protein [Eggerthellaceae bacterium]|nr:nitrate ABC transporter substrate-binding protein [Eggerthellaceae bacterium]